ARWGICAVDQRATSFFRWRDECAKDVLGWRVDERRRRRCPRGWRRWWWGQAVSAAGRRHSHRLRLGRLVGVGGGSVREAHGGGGVGGVRGAEGGGEGRWGGVL